MKEAIDIGGDADERLQNAVSEGLSEARQRVLSEPAESSAQEAASAETGAEGLEQQRESNVPVTLHGKDSADSEAADAESEDRGLQERGQERELVADSRNSNKA